MRLMRGTGIRILNRHIGTNHICLEIPSAEPREMTLTNLTKTDLMREKISLHKVNGPNPRWLSPRPGPFVGDQGARCATSHPETIGKCGDISRDVFVSFHH